MAKDQRPRSELTPEENKARTKREVADALDADPSKVSGTTAKPASSVTPGSRSGHVGRRGEVPGVGELVETDIASSGHAETERLSEYLRRVHGRAPAPITVVKESGSVTGHPLLDYWIERAIEVNYPHQGAPGARSAKAMEVLWRHKLSTPEGWVAFVNSVRYRGK